MPQKAIKDREKIAHSLRMQHPSWDKKKIESTSYAIEQSNWEKEHGKPAFTGKD